MLKINYFNQYDDLTTYKPTIVKVLKQAYIDINLKSTKIINIILVDNQAIQELNKTYRQIDQPTDVLSFDNPEDDLELGDVFISIDKAKDQAIAYHHSFERELAFLTCHGFLHCNGYDHQNKEEEKTMFDLQESILEHISLKR